MPYNRLRRLRRNSQIRELISEAHLAVSHLIMPYFIVEGEGRREPVKSMPGIYRFSVDEAVKDIKETKKLGLKAILLFGIPAKRDEAGTEAFREDGIVQQAVQAIKKNVEEMILITDVCLCGYTSHGHCGIVKSVAARHTVPVQVKGQGSSVQDRGQEFYVDNDETLKVLTKIALSHAKAGADFVAPSSMMDGQVKLIREALHMNGYHDVGILAYSAKYASNFYGPFREALDSRPHFGDRKSYQMDYRNSDEALREIEQDISEGADIVMVKPALAYLDIIQRARQKFPVPIAVYNVSGEYALVKGGAKERIVSEKDIVLEILTALKRAGADLIITYHAKDVGRWLGGRSSHE
jgi:porphobilinogen synthase